MLADGLFGIGYRREQGEEAVDLRHFEEFEDAAVDAGDDQPATGPLRGDVVVDDGTHASRIHVGDSGEVEDERGWWIIAESALEVKETTEGERPGQPEDSAARSLPGDAFQRQRFGGHA